MKQSQDRPQTTSAVKVPTLLNTLNLTCWQFDTYAHVEMELKA